MGVREDDGKTVFGDILEERALPQLAAAAAVMHRTKERAELRSFIVAVKREEGGRGEGTKENQARNGQWLTFADFYMKTCRPSNSLPLFFLFM